MCRGSLPASDWQGPGARVPGPLPFRPVDLGQAQVVVMREACVPRKLMPPHARSDGGQDLGGGGYQARRKAGVAALDLSSRSSWTGRHFKVDMIKRERA